MKYSPEWARARIKEWWQAHARAAFFLIRVLDITVEDLAKWLGSNDPRWNLCKGLVKLAEDYSFVGQDGPYVSLCYTAWSNLLTENSTYGSDWLLTRVESSPMLKKRSRERRAKPAPENSLSRDLPGQLLLFDVEV